MTGAYYHKVAITSDRKSVHLILERLPEDLLDQYVEESFIPEESVPGALDEDSYSRPRDNSVSLAFFYEERDAALITMSRLREAGFSDISMEAVCIDQFPRLIDVGEKYRVIFLNSGVDNKEGRRPLYISGSQIFGTGEHPTTKLMIHALETYDMTEKTCIDAGAGSCILSLVALHEGCGRLEAFDIQKGFKEIAKETMEANGVFFSAFEMDQKEYVEMNKTFVSRADILMINMLPVNGNPVAEMIIPHLRKGAEIMVSGIPGDKKAATMELYKQLGVEIVETKKSGQWIYFKSVKKQ